MYKSKINYIFIFLAATFFVSCKNNDDIKTAQVKLKNLNMLSSQNNNDDEYSEETLIKTGESAPASIFQGFNKMGFSFTEFCLEKKNVEYPKEVERTVVNLSENLKENDFKNALHVGSSAEISIKGFDISPELKFSKEAAVSRLSRSITYSVYVKLGEAKFVNNPNDSLKINPYLNKYFNNSGELIDSYRFVKKCGDEVVTSQKLSAKVLITLKLNFDSISLLKSFESKVGIASNVLKVGEKIGVNINLKELDVNTKKGVHLNLYAIQLGGKPIELTRIVGAKNSCNLNKIEECVNTINKLTQYVSESFYSQLDANNIATWFVETSNTTPYDELNIVNQEENLLSFNWTKNYAESTSYSSLRTIVNQKISKEVDNYFVANNILENLSLTDKERESINDVIKNSQQNIDSLQNFSKECYKDLSNCLANSETMLQQILLKYDDSVLNIKFGTLIARVKSSKIPLPGQKNRSSEDFLDIKSIIDSGKYHSIFFRTKTIDNQEISDKKVRFNLMCNKPWFKGPDPVIFNAVYAGFESMVDGLQKRYDALCSGNEMVYVATPRNVDFNDFIIEVWGRE
ncbi:MAG: hypothetical protein DCC88_06260 [Spirobacillus cienkowskii]|uniref:MACPF domain-containing protein n=1 Tax=Spirobacillus cienkowskii TaxID=495820 RepID=A0A369KND1_9BACT|nr:MAG: hypothetical protein DCC88_06260 [Spirobacillus cienkowskii]